MAQAFPGPYVDVALTQRGPYSQSGDAVTPAVPNAKTLGAVTIYDVAGRAVATPLGSANFASLNSGAPAKPPSPSAMVLGRDPYKNGGMVGQTFFN